MQGLLIVAGVGLLIGLGLVLARFAVQVARIEERNAHLDGRLKQLEEERPGKRLSHRDTLDIENASAAVIKVLRDLDNLRDYTENSLYWLGKVRGLANDDDESK